MAVTVGSLFDTHSDVIKEEIGRAATEFMPATDPIFRGMILSQMAGSAEGELGRDLLIKKRYYGSLAGEIEGGIGTDEFALYGDLTQAFGPKMHLKNLNQTFPTGLGGANPTPYNFACGLFSMQTGLALTLAMMQLEALPANIMEHVVPVLRGFANQISVWSANQFYANSANQYRLSSIPGSGVNAVAVIAATPDFSITFLPVEKSTHRFSVGMPVDIYENDTATGTLVNKSDSTLSRVRMFVSAVNDWTNEVELRADPSELAEDGTAATFATWATLANMTQLSYVVYAKTGDNAASASFRGLYGWRDWYKAGASTATTAERQILGDNAIANETLDVSVHPEFYSGRYDHSGASLTRNELLGYLQNVHRALTRNKYYVDTLIASQGVFLNMFDEMVNPGGATELERFNVPQGGANVGSINRIGLEDGFSVVCEGRTYKGYTSYFLEDGNMLGLRLGGNWSMVTPPDPAGTQRAMGSLPEGEGKIPLLWVVPALTGGTSHRFPILDPSTGKLTEGTQMPGYLRMQFMPKNQIPGFWIEDIATTLEFSDSIT